MKLIPCDVMLAGGGKKRKYARNFKLLTEFIKSNEKCAEVTEYTNKDAKSCAGSLQLSIKRYRMNQIFCTLHKDKVYLVRTDIV